jgi:G3E family GTPase
LITNDQAEGLVDSVYLRQSGSNVHEVSGSCFCCNFDGFVEAIKGAITNGNADVIIAEPVGSCTDLTATIIRPLLVNHPGLVEIAPLTVLTDPDRLRHSFNGIHGGLHDSAAYIYGKQLEDAGIILVGKADLMNENEIQSLVEKTNAKFGHGTTKAISSRNKQGLEEWLNEMMQDTYHSMKTVEMDYDIYAEGEAVLGWLNTELELNAERGVNWDTWFRTMMETLAAEIDLRKLTVGHVKAILQEGKDSMLANITGSRDTLQFRGQMTPGMKANLTINARVQTEPSMLEELVFQVFENSLDWEGERKIISLNCLSPGRPNPTYRLSS